MGYNSMIIQAGRVVAHGKITSLTTAFNLDNGQTPFSLFIIEKASGAQDPVIVECTTFKGSSSADCPFTPNCWDVPLVKEIAISGIDLTLYDVYYGAGSEVTDD